MSKTTLNHEWAVTPLSHAIRRSFQIMLIVIVSMLAVLLCPGTTFATTSGNCGDGLTWTLSDEGKLVISGSGKLTDIKWNEKDVLEVSIPAGVTSMEEGMFLGCSNCVKIDVSPSNKYYSSVNGVLLNKDKTVLVEFPAGKGGAYTIPGTVKTIKIGAFASCKKLTSVTMPNSVTTLSKYAFNCCEGLTKVVISKNVKTIPGDCFSGCTSLTSVTIPEGVQRIGEAAFWGCTSLAKITLPKSLDKNGIADSAFERCPLDAKSRAAVNEKVKAPLETTDELKVGESKDLELSPIVKGSLFEGAFYAESSDKSVVKIRTLTRTGNIVVNSNEVKYFYELGVKAVGPGKAVVTVYSDKTMKTVISKSTFIVKGTVTSGNGIYRLSGSVASLVKPKNKNITNLSIPATVSANGKKFKVTAISAKSCKGLKNLKSVTIGKNVKSIGKSAFQSCRKLKTITFKTTKLTAKKVGANAFKGINSKATIKVPKKKLFAYKKLLKKKGIGKKVKITK